MSPAPAAGPQTVPWGVLAVLACGAAVALNIGKVPVALPVMRPELGLSLVQAGWVSSVLTSLALLLGAAAGSLVGERFAALHMVLGGLLVCAAGCAAALVLPAGFAVLMVSRLLEGLGFLAVAVAAPALISAAAAPAQRRFALGLWSAYMPLGAGVAMLVSPLLLPAGGWRSLWMMALLGLVVAAGLLWRQRQVWQAHPAPTAAAALGPADDGGPSGAPTAASWPGPASPVLKQALPWLLGLCFGAWAVQHFALIVWMPTVLREQHGASPTLTALLTSVMLLACIPGNLMGGVLVQRGLPRGRLLALGHLGAGLGALAYSSPAPEALRYAAAVGVSFVGGVIPAAVMASSTMLAHSPRHIGILQGLYLQGAQLGQFVGTPSIAAAVSAGGSWNHALWITLPACGLGLLLASAAGRLERPAHGPAARPAPVAAAPSPRWRP